MHIKTTILCLLLVAFFVLIYFYVASVENKDLFLALISMVWSAVIGDLLFMYYDAKQDQQELHITNTIINAIYFITRNPDDPCPQVNDDLKLVYSHIRRDSNREVKKIKF